MILRINWPVFTTK